jgi:hypothetical protein
LISPSNFFYAPGLNGVTIKKLGKKKENPKNFENGESILIKSDDENNPGKWVNRMNLNHLLYYHRNNFTSFIGL